MLNFTGRIRIRYCAVIDVLCREANARKRHQSKSKAGQCV